MAESRDLEEDFGGPYADARPVTNPETDLSAAKMTRALEDVCHFSRTAPKARIVFTTRNDNDDCVILAFRSQWGNVVATETVARTATGLYTATLATSYTDDAEATETVALYDGDPRMRSTDTTDDVFARVVSVTANTVSFQVESPKGTLADYGDQSAAAITGVIDLY